MIDIIYLNSLDILKQISLIYHFALHTVLQSCYARHGDAETLITDAAVMIQLIT